MNGTVSRFDGSAREISIRSYMNGQILAVPMKRPLTVQKKIIVRRRCRQDYYSTREARTVSGGQKHEVPGFFQKGH